LPADQKIQDTSEDVEKEDHKDPNEFVIALKLTADDIYQGN
jgi:hypothetical protein